MSFERTRASTAFTKSLLPPANNLQTSSAQLVNAPCPKLERLFCKHPSSGLESLTNQIPKQQDGGPLLSLFGISWKFEVGYSQQQIASDRN